MMLYRLRNELAVLLLLSVLSSACAIMKWGCGAFASGFLFGCVIASVDFFLVAKNVENIGLAGPGCRRVWRIFYCFAGRLSLIGSFLVFGAAMLVNMAGIGIGIAFMVAALLSRMSLTLRGRPVIGEGIGVSRS